MTIRLIPGDARARLSELPDESVHCVVTSPPYWGLRDYGIEPVVWGGDAGCAHEWGDASPTLTGRNDTERETPGGRGGSFRGGPRNEATTGQFCRHCDAWRGSLGLEPTPDLYVQHMVEVFREIRRVLRKDGTVWLNLGDSYAANRSYQVTDGKHVDVCNNAGAKVPPGLKPKDLIGIPWMVAFALRADGWYLRSDIIWAKPNPMPESVTDRPTSAYEHVFLLTKSARYWYDADAVREADSGQNGRAANFARETKDITGPGQSKAQHRVDRDPTIATGTRNLRNVWNIATHPYPEAHFATFPPALVELCIKAGCPEGGTVLDPFGGSGTTGLVADRLQRNAILIEINLEYAAMAEARIHSDAPMFAEVTRP